MGDDEVQISKRLKAIGMVLEWFAIVGAAVTFGFVGGGIMIAIFHFLKPRTSPRRAQIGIAISILPAALLVLVLYGQLELKREIAAHSARWEGVESPPFSFVTLDGKRIDSSDLRGKRVLLNFWATWCPACRTEIPEINGLYASATDSDVVVFGISSESEAVIRQFVSENKIDYPLVSLPDGTLLPPYDRVVALPTSYVIDRNGIIQFVRAGYISAEDLKATVWDAADHPGQGASAPKVPAPQAEAG